MSKQNSFHQKKQSLSDLISVRKTKADVAELGYIDDSGMVLINYIFYLSNMISEYIIY